VTLNPAASAGWWYTTERRRLTFFSLYHPNLLSWFAMGWPCLRQKQPCEIPREKTPLINPNVTFDSSSLG
ncbi:MAG: hypothetical protein E7G91_14720, partial [Serratia liquefaciens]|nr:hypothetical protein [Serratia liquefaciens]